MSAVFGGALAAGLFLVFAGYIIKYLRFLFPPLITGLCILLIGINLLPLAFSLAFGGADAADFGATRHSLLAVTVLVTAIVLHQFGKGFLSLVSIIIAMIAGYLIAWFMGFIDLARTGAGQVGGHSRSGAVRSEFRVFRGVQFCPDLTGGDYRNHR